MGEPVVAQKRKPGPPKGVKVGGRKAGTPNKATAEIKDVARSYGPEAIKRLWELAGTSESDQAKVAALREILDRGYGKASQVIAGDKDNPVVFQQIERVIIDPAKTE